MAKRSVSKIAVKPSAKAKTGSLAASLAAYLKTKAPTEDVASYDGATLEAAAALAAQALEQHRVGSTIIAIDDAALKRDGRPVSAITIVNDNMPFLFDSVMGEIAEVAGEPTLVVHPVFGVRHTKTGVQDIVEDGQARKHDADADRVSLIHVHVPRLAEEQSRALHDRLAALLKQIRAVVTDWRPMLARLDQAISQFRYAPSPLAKDDVAEAVAFLEWLRDDNFTFLGMREFVYSGDEKGGTLKRVKEPGLGMLSDPDVTVLRRDTHSSDTTSAEVRAFLYGPEPLIVTKANAKSNIHRRAYLDYIGVKKFNDKGKLVGELRIVGLFTSTAYTRSVMKIPYLRSKAETVIAKSGYDPHDHAGKALINVLESYPRDELFQTPLPLLRKHSEAILGLVDRPRVRALVRVDQFDRFVSVMVFVPRDRYDSIVREKIGDYLKTVFDGRVSAYYPAFPEGGLTRVHFIIGRSGGKTPDVKQADIEAAIRDIVRTWEDAMREAASGSADDARLVAIAGRFPKSYQDSFSSQTALEDSRRIVALDAQNAIDIDYYRDAGQKPNELSLKIYHHGAPVALSRRVPILENMGFRVISERTFAVGDENSDTVYIHDMELESGYDRPVDLADEGVLFEETFLSVWRGEADNDGFNALAQTAGLHPGELGLLRAYGRYLQQAGIPQSQEFIAATLNRYPDIARGLYNLFAALFDPAAKDGEVTAKHLKAKIKDALDEVPNIDDDTIIRRYLNL
ncbi:NAD-glutamate dehydrogenase, partial [Salmonella enterica subsp. enterica]|nr:NAD-glutamate dehydrogenase [Salmonella enterica subsp. enterica serovar Enteritidis]